MQNKEEFEKLINNLREKIDDTTSAMISEDLLAALAAYNSGYDEYEKIIEDVQKLKDEKEELLKVNGKLYQKIGFDKKEDENEEKRSIDEEKEEIKIEDVINEKGEMI